jgi:hypothetical protein
MPAAIRDDQRNAIIERIATLMAEGKGIVEACEGRGLPRVQTVYEWMEMYPEVANRIARARETQAEAMDRRVCDIAAKVAAGEMDPRAGAVAISAYQWRARHLKPRVYGDKQQVQVDHSGSVELVLSEERRMKLIELRAAAAKFVENQRLTDEKRSE